jgi:hypothetical protein
MQVNDVDRATLRRLAGLRAEEDRVLSLFVSLDPSRFATPGARASQLKSLCDEAERQARDVPGLSHDSRAALLGDVDRARTALDDGDVARGAHGVALYACTPLGLFEVLRLPRPVEPAVAIADSPSVARLVGIASLPRLCAALVSRRTTRLLCGTTEGLEEVAAFQDDVHGHHDQGGWSQARYQRAIQEEVDDHLRRTAEALRRHLRSRPEEHLLIGAPGDLYAHLEGRLHPDVGARLAGRVDVDVEHSSPADVLEAAAPAVEDLCRRGEREAMDRLADGLGRGGAATGLDDVLGSLHERRVETLLYEEGAPRPGRVCPRCGWASSAAQSCPVDGTATRERDDLLEPAVESAIVQDADVIALPPDGRLGAQDGIAALLRF